MRITDVWVRKVRGTVATGANFWEDRQVGPMDVYQTHRNAPLTPPGGRELADGRFTEHLDLQVVRPSIGTVGDAVDNALMESVTGLYKTECIRTTVFHASPYRITADVEYASSG